MAVNRALVLLFWMVICAFGTTAPVASLTIPVNFPVVETCAKAPAARSGIVSRVQARANTRPRQVFRVVLIRASKSGLKSRVLLCLTSDCYENAGACGKNVYVRDVRLCIARSCA